MDEQVALHGRLFHGRVKYTWGGLNCGGGTTAKVRLANFIKACPPSHEHCQHRRGALCISATNWQVLDILPAQRNKVCLPVQEGECWWDFVRRGISQITGTAERGLCSCCPRGGGCFSPQALQCGTEQVQTSPDRIIFKDFPADFPPQAGCEQAEADGDRARREAPPLFLNTEPASSRAGLEFHSICH